VTFDEYVSAYLPRLTRFAAVLTADRSLAEDVLHSVLAKVCAQWDRVGAADSPHAYVRRMVVNEHLSWHRRRARLVLLADLDDLMPTTPDHAAEHAQRVDLLARVQQLPARQRAVIVLRYYEELDDNEIARTLGCGVSTVRSNIARALATLRVSAGHDLRMEAR
jgi:RNA polymerase sigma-70 factor (sigma-E family)